jgi:hypothetical protein
LHRLVCTPNRHLTIGRELVLAEEGREWVQAFPALVSVGRQKPVAAMMEPFK